MFIRLQRTGVILLFVALISGWVGVAQAKRIALVVGISAYTYSPQLPNPRSDAQRISESLTKMGFDVITALDVDLAHLTADLEAFYEQAQDADAALFYFAGHGLQVRGTNYIVPTNAQLRTEERLLQETVPLQQIEDGGAG